MGDAVDFLLLLLVVVVLVWGWVIDYRAESGRTGNNSSTTRP